MTKQVVLQIVLDDYGYHVMCGATPVGHAHSLRLALKEADMTGLIIATHNACGVLIVEVEECLRDFLPKERRFSYAG